MKNKIFTNNSKYIYGDEGRNSLEKLLKPFDFLTYPEDGIKDVKITLMRLRPFMAIVISPSLCQKVGKDIFMKLWAARLIMIILIAVISWLKR